MAQAAAAGKARGRAADVVAVTLPGKAWAELTTANMAFATARKTNSDSAWTVSLTTAGAALDATSEGAHDAQWSGLGKVLATLPARPVLTLTTPADADPAQAKTAFRRAAALVKKNAPQTVITWRAPLGKTPTATATAYPGDDAVDVIGLHLPSAGTWADTLSGAGGLTAWSDWAAQHGKRIAITWSIGKATSSTWVRNVRTFVELSATQKRVAYESTATTAGNKAAVATYLQLW